MSRPRSNGLITLFNPWIGCAKVSAGCDNCLDPATLVLYHDQRWRPLAEVLPGDRLMGFPERGFCGGDLLGDVLEVAVVERVWRTTAEAARIVTAEASIVASLDHRFLCGGAGDGDWEQVAQMRPQQTALRHISVEDPGAATVDGLPWLASPVTAVEPVGTRALIDIQTSTGTFFAEGFATHNCYAESLSARWGWHDWDNRTPRKPMSDNYWRQPLRWNRHAARTGIRERVFCASLADVFDPKGPASERERLWDLIRETPHLDWQLLTKRPNQAERFLPDGFCAEAWPNVWIGCTAEDQENFDIRWPHMSRIPAEVRFVSYEPMVGALDLRDRDAGPAFATLPDWVIWGGESGHHARRCDQRWARRITRDCQQRGIAVFGKQWGTYACNPMMELCPMPEGSPGHSAFLELVKAIDPPAHGKGGALLDGRLYREFPRDAAVPLLAA